MNLRALFKNKTLKNTWWIVGGRVVYMAISFVVGVLTANYLGPSNQGLIDYASSFTTFFSSACTLGIGSIIIKNFVDYPDEQGKTLGTAIVLRFISSFISLLLIIGIVSIIDYGENTTILVVALVSTSLCFQIFDAFNEWFQNRLQSKYSSLATLLGYIVVSAYRVVLLVTKKSVYWFAVSLIIDYVVIALCLGIAYKKNNGPKLSFSKEKAKQLLKSSYHFIFSGLMISIYHATDKLMLKQMISEVEVGYYGRANSVSNMWCFVLTAINASVTPNIIRHHKNKSSAYETRNRQLYAVVFYLSMIVSIVLTFAGDWVIGFLYEPEYMPSANVLKVLTWLTAFSYLGVARNVWVVCEGQQKHLKWLYLAAAVGNVVLNFIFIPMWGAVGAAFTSVITQVLTAIIIPIFIKGLRPNVKLMLESFILKGVLWGKKKQPETMEDLDSKENQ